MVPAADSPADRTAARLAGFPGRPAVVSPVRGRHEAHRSEMEGCLAHPAPARASRPVASRPASRRPRQAQPPATVTRRSGRHQATRSATRRHHRPAKASRCGPVGAIPATVSGPRPLDFALGVASVSLRPCPGPPVRLSARSAIRCRYLDQSSACDDCPPRRGAARSGPVGPASPARTRVRSPAADRPSVPSLVVDVERPGRTPARIRR